MAGSSLVLVAALTLAQGPSSSTPPLTQEQRERIRPLVIETQREARLLKALLEEGESELYAEYELDEARVAKIEAEILDLQRRMLANHRRIQVELRTIVGKEQFLVLKKRLERILQSPPTPAPGGPPEKADPPPRR